MYNLCHLNTHTHTLTPSADLCMGWVPPGGFGHLGTAAAPRAARVWGAPAGRPERADSFWRWCSTLHSSAGGTLGLTECGAAVSGDSGKNDKNEDFYYFLDWQQAFLPLSVYVSIIWEDWFCDFWVIPAGLWNPKNVSFFSRQFWKRSCRNLLLKYWHTSV